MLWYFKYNPQTFELLPGAVYAEEQPENSTAVDPGATTFPVYVPSTDSWKPDEVKLAEWKKNKANDIKQFDSDKQMLASVMETMMKQEMRIKQLEAERAGGAE